MTTSNPATKAPAISASDGLQNVMAGLGMSGDKRAHSYWGQARVLQQVELENMYRSSWLAKRIVNSPAEDMTREWLTISFDGDDDKQFEIEKLAKKHKVQHKVTEALTWARLYGGAAIVIGIKGQKLDKPLKIETLKADCLQYLRVLDRHQLTPNGRVTEDLESDNFGLPDAYTINNSTTSVHHTRVLIFDGQKLPYQVWQTNGYWHDSELTHVRESLLNADTASAAIATMLFEANVDVIKAGDLINLMSTKGGEAKAVKRFQLAMQMKSFNRTLLLDATETYEKKGNNFANLDKVWLQFMVDVCGAADIPMTRLFGQSAGGLNSTGDGDLRNYYDMLASRQQSELLEPVEALYRILGASALGSAPDDLEINFVPLWQVSASEKSTIEKTQAERDKAYLDMGVIDEGLIARELLERGTYPNMTDEDVKMAEELALEPEPVPMLPGAVDPATGLPVPTPTLPPNGPPVPPNDDPGAPVVKLPPNGKGSDDVQA